MRRLLAGVALAWLSGCALTVSEPRALNAIDGFTPLAAEPRVWVEPG
jgi:hypothetical protein